MTDYCRNYRHPLSAPFAHSVRRIGRALVMVARQVIAECRRLNHGGDYLLLTGNKSRSLNSMAFKASLAQRYGDHHRCC